MDELIRQIGINLAAQITREVMENVRRELVEINKEGIVFCYSEEEAAAKLGVGKQVLYKKRKSGEIDFSRSPSGKPVYLPRHISEYLEREEIRNGETTTTNSSNTDVKTEFNGLKLAG